MYIKSEHFSACEILIKFFLKRGKKQEVILAFQHLGKSLISLMIKMEIQTTRYRFLALKLAKIFIPMFDEIPNVVKGAAKVIYSLPAGGSSLVQLSKNNLASHSFTSGSKIY